MKSEIKGTNTYNKGFFVVGIAKTVADENDARIDEESNEYAGSDDLGIGILVFVQVPGSTDA